MSFLSPFSSNWKQARDKLKNLLFEPEEQASDLVSTLTEPIAQDDASRYSVSPVNTLSLSSDTLAALDAPSRVINRHQGSSSILSTDASIQSGQWNTQITENEQLRERIQVLENELSAKDAIIETLQLQYQALEEWMQQQVRQFFDLQDQIKALQQDQSAQFRALTRFMDSIRVDQFLSFYETAIQIVLERPVYRFFLTWPRYHDKDDDSIAVASDVHTVRYTFPMETFAYFRDYYLALETNNVSHVLQSEGQEQQEEPMHPKHAFSQQQQRPQQQHVQQQPLPVIKMLSASSLNQLADKYTFLKKSKPWERDLINMVAYCLVTIPVFVDEYTSQVFTVYQDVFHMPQIQDAISVESGSFLNQWNQYMRRIQSKKQEALESILSLKVTHWVRQGVWLRRIYHQMTQQLIQQQNKMTSSLYIQRPVYSAKQCCQCYNARYLTLFHVQHLFYRYIGQVVPLAKEQILTWSVKQIMDYVYTLDAPVTIKGNAKHLLSNRVHDLIQRLFLNQQQDATADTTFLLQDDKLFVSFDDFAQHFKEETLNEMLAQNDTVQEDKQKMMDILVELLDFILFDMFIPI